MARKFFLFVCIMRVCRAGFHCYCRNCALLFGWDSLACITRALTMQYRCLSLSLSLTTEPNPAQTLITTILENHEISPQDIPVRLSKLESSLSLSCHSVHSGPSLCLGGKNTHRRSGFVIWRSLPPTLSLSLCFFLSFFPS